MALSTTEYSSLLQKITELETTVRGIQVNIEVNGHCGYDNDMTVPLFLNSGVDKANSLPARANKAIRPREDPVPVDKPTGVSPPWNTLGAKPKKKSYPLQRLTGRAKRPDINNETDWPALPSQTVASTSTPLSAQAQKWTSAKSRSITKSQTQFHVELGNRFAPLLKGKQKRHSSNVKVICLPNDTVSDLADKFLHIVADYPHLKNVVIHFGLNDLAKEESEVLKQDFTHLLKTACGKSIFISGPLPTLNRDIEQFSCLLQHHNFLQSCCKLHNFTFIDNFDLFWKRADLFKKDGVHPNLHGAQMLKLNLQSVIHNSTRA
uniref:SGNH hydrolase-type esterase domain-containing protein n=1 Tax=Gouania willdenowi TaxID=441366 RepID=A0A8C5D423_GOUWI